MNGEETSAQATVGTVEDNSLEVFIISLAFTVEGIGRAKAGSIASDFDNLDEFITADSDRLKRIKKSNGDSVLTDSQIEGLLKAKEPFEAGKTIEETWVFYLGRKFLIEQVEMVKRLSLDSFDVNPLLAKALSLKTPLEVISFNVYQTVTRSVVTSWGNTVEEMAKRVGCRDNDFIIEDQTGTNFDLLKPLNGIDYYIQVKSGPNTMNVGMVTSLNKAIRKIEEHNPNARGILGMTYGVRSRISNQITANLENADERMKIGREFWDFISEKQDFYKTLFEILDSSSSEILSGSFIDLIEEKIKEIENEWKSRHNGESLDKTLEEYI